MHWKMREHFWVLRQDGRLEVLLQYILHANIRNRAWPSDETIHRNTGYGTQAISAAKTWLISHHALVKVDFAHRVDSEIDLHPRKTIMQLTGALVLTGEDDKRYAAGLVIPYLYLTPEGLESVVYQLQILGYPLIIKELNLCFSNVLTIKDEVTKGKAFKVIPDSGGIPDATILYDVIQDVWHYTGGFNVDFGKMLLGVATKKGYKEYNLNPAIAPDDLRNWADWWCKTNPGLSILEKHGKVVSSIGYWRSIGSPTVSSDAGGIYKPYE